MNENIVVFGQLVQRGTALVNLALSAVTLLLVIWGFKR